MTESALHSNVAQRFNSAPFVRHLGIQLERVAPGLACSRMEIGEEHLQQDDYAHAGVIATLADHTGGAAGWTVVDIDKTVLTVEFNVHFLRPARVKTLHCQATVLRAGRKLITAESEVIDPDGEHIAKLTMTLAVVARTQPPAGAGKQRP